VIENRVYRRIFGPKKDEVMGGWRKLHNEELHNLYPFTKYYQNDEVKENEMGRSYNMKGAKRTAYRVLVGEPEIKRPLGRPRHR
jgi:hypothetical protein